MSEFAPGKSSSADIHSLLWGLRDAMQAEESKSVEWDRILDYCTNVVAAPPEQVRLVWEGGSEALSGWHISGVARLLDVGISTQRLEPSSRVLCILLSMMESVQASRPNGVAESDGSREPWDSALDDAGSLTLTALLQYAHQIGWRDPDRSKGGWEAWNRLDPDVKAVLERQLSLGSRLTKSARSVFGRFLPHLAWLDYHWTQENLGLILPVHDARGEEWWAAWASYLLLSEFYRKMMPLLRDEYLRGVSRLAGDRPPWAERSDLGLALHIMNAMCLDVEPYSCEASLSRAFFEKAPAQQRGEAVRSLGNWVRERAFPEFDKVWTMLKRLWRERVAETSPRDSEELAEFAFWLEGASEGPSAIRDLIQPIIGPAITHHQGTFLIRYLARHAGDQPAAVELLNAFLQALKPGWIVYPKQEIRSILHAARASNSEDAVRALDDAVNRLGELGSKEFRDLLPEAA